MDENNLDVSNNHGCDENVDISDVIEIIETDPDFRESSMFNGGYEIPQGSNIRRSPHPTHQSHNPNQAYVRIVEQPAPKALRFRYECEGRSAGSIPGASSTPENKTFPSIQVVGYQGKAVVVVSCVTKDEPYRPHPHNLVGREGCRRGVCTLEIPPDTMTMTFPNLGIQCVKKKDIEHHLRVREEIRVDPFRTGFNHKNQPTSIDLNAVRLCFQVFLERDKTGKCTVPLTPVVSEPIFDKKAMSDLVIVKLSDCVSYVDGGRKEIILLCEKVAKEDIQVRFFEEKDNVTVWEGFGDFQPSQVHKQTAICFRTPRYHTLDITEPVKVFIQLRRPSDSATSEPLPFELLPLDSGRPPYWSFRRNLIKKGNYNLLNTLIANDAKLLAQRYINTQQISKQPKNTQFLEKTVINLTEEDDMDKNIICELNNNEILTENREKENVTQTLNTNSSDDKSFHDLIDQVAELDEIYSGTQHQLSENSNNEKQKLADLQNNNSFDDARTYSSLQLAFRNPISLNNNHQQYDAVLVNPESPIIDLNSSTNNNNKRENEQEKKPPLPPKRVKKLETFIGGSNQSIHLTEKQAQRLLHSSNSSLKAIPVDRTDSFNLQRHKSHGDLNPPTKRLPPTPCSTLPNPKKQSYLSKLFGRKRKTPNVSRETSLSPSHHSFSSSQTLLIENKLGQSIGNVSNRSSTSIRIPLKDGSPSLGVKLPEVRHNFDPTGEELAMNLDLTEAEHYALYTSMAPHATQSEFDETSCYYAPVEGGKLLTQAEVANRLASKT